MKFIKIFLCVLLILSILTPVFGIGSVSAALNISNKKPDTPVWTVAWITVPQVKVTFGSEIKTVIFPQERINYFNRAASVFKNYIEQNTNNAVEIKITFISIDIIPEFTSDYNDRIGFRARLTDEIKEKYNINDYDTWMVGWPFHQFWELSENNIWVMNETNKNWNWTNNEGHLISANLTYDTREIYLEAESSVDRYRFTSIHEFLHITEFWFRDRLGFELPYNIECIGNGHYALHNPEYFGYGSEYMVIGEVDFNFFADWLSNSVRDPNSRRKKYLGIPEEAWLHTPAKKIPVILEYNDESKQIETTYKNGIVPSDNSEAYIDLNSEMLILPETFAQSMKNPAYSTDGGKKWQKGKISIKQFPKLLGKKISLVLTNDYNSKTKQPAQDSVIITFETVEKRPKTNAGNLRISHSFDSGMWTLAKNGKGQAVLEGYQIALSQNTQAPPLNTDIWEAMPESGIPIMPHGTKRRFYFVRSLPLTEDGLYIPASRPFRVSPENQPRSKS